MTKFSGNAKYMLLGAALLGLTSTSAFSQQIPDQIKITRNAVNSVTRDVESYIATLVSKCDKCDSSSKSGSQKAIAALRRALDDLQKTTDTQFVEMARICVKK